MPPDTEQPWVAPRLAVLGCAGLVGATVLRSLANRPDLWNEVILLDVAERSGQIIPVRSEYRRVAALTVEALAEVDIVVCALPPDLAGRWAPIAAEQGALVVDCSGVFRADPAIPLVATGVNANEAFHVEQRIVSSPGSLALSAMMALAPLHEQYTIRELTVTAMVPASAAGRRGIERLLTETAAVAGRRDLGNRAGDVRARLLETLDQETSPFASPLALNVCPWVGDEAEDYNSTLEDAFCTEVQRLLGSDDVRVTATCVQVPVLIGETAVFTVRFEKASPVDQVRSVLMSAPGVVVVDDVAHNEFPTPIDAVGSDPAFCGRIRRLPDTQRGVMFVQCSDNLRLGSALNAVQIAEQLATVGTGGEPPAAV